MISDAKKMFFLLKNKFIFLQQDYFLTKRKKILCQVKEKVFLPTTAQRCCSETGKKYFRGLFSSVMS